MEFLPWEQDFSRARFGGRSAPFGVSGQAGFVPSLCPSFPSADENLGLRFGAETGDFHPFSGQVPSGLGALLPDLHPEELGKSAALGALGSAVGGEENLGSRDAGGEHEPHPRGPVCLAGGGWSGADPAETSPPLGADPASSFQECFHKEQLSSLGFRDAIRVTEEDTR